MVDITHNKHFTAYLELPIQNMKKLGDLIDSSLIQQAELFAAMSASARSRLPQNIASHCWVGGYEKNYLVLVTDYPHYAIYIRCHQREILKQIKEEFSGHLPENIKKIRIRVSRILAED